ncbi:hypothetical protein DFQ28_009400 [Apophysomyces sp. BC1034]|nr:hypothetical protein DFQ30_008464 [Apophysomyces sp. BC1015]KAG0174600.1 hypothetical protein DFQ29_007435 [Apophysomyces sp. BC1021]KAG0185402.1 hypothetical protein DFQ28_009400 [Apophysomyces sp. BC1034]
MTEKKPLNTVLLGTCLSATVGATTGTMLAVLKPAPIGQYALSTGLNCGVFGATFLMVRETFLSYQRSKNPLYGLKDSQTRDLDDLVSSTMAGITTGGLLSALYRGPRGVLPGSIMFGTITAGAQILYSAGNRWRQDKIVRREQNREDEESVSFFDYIQVPWWSPIRPLSNEEYEQLLDERLQVLEAEVEAIEQEFNKKNA